jgi:hypothetical protein
VISPPRGLCWFFPGVTGEHHMTLATHRFGLPNVSQVSLELVAVTSVYPPVFSVKHVMEKLSTGWGLGYQSFDSPWCFISTKYGCRVSAKFMIYGAHIVFCTLVAIGSSFR